MENGRQIARLIDELLNHADYDMRRKAARKLGNCDSKEAVEPLKTSLSDPDEDVRVEVLKALSKVGDQGLCCHIAPCVSDQSPEVRIQALKVLKKLECIENIPDIFLRLNDPDWSVRNQARKTLFALIDLVMKTPLENGMPILLHLLSSDEPSVRRKVEESFIEQGEESVDTLCELLEDGTLKQKISIAYILSKIRSSRTIFPLINALEDRNPRVRRAVVRALGELKPPEAIQPLIRCLGNAHDEVRHEAVKTLTNYGNEAVLPLVRTLIMSRDSYIRRNAATILGNIGDVRAISALIASLSDSYFLVREAVEKALLKFGEPIAGRLIAMLKPVYYNLELGKQFVQSPLEAERLKGIEILDDISDPRSVKILQSLLRDPSTKVQEQAQKVLFSLGCKAWARTGAARLLGEMRIQKASPALVEALNDPDKDVRIESIRSLGLLRYHEAIPQLIEKLKDSKPETRKNACWALGRIGDQKALPHLIEALHDVDAETRFNAIRALGKLLDPRAAIPLLKLIPLSGFRQKEAIINALKTIGRRAIPEVIASLNTQDKEMLMAIDEFLHFVKQDLTNEMIQEIAQRLTESQRQYFYQTIGYEHERSS